MYFDVVLNIGSEEVVGYVADFCPICRKITPFLLHARKNSDECYRIPGSERKAKYRGTCRSCNVPKFHDNQAFKEISAYNP